MLVNTSFNVRGEPIVCTPEDAYRCFMRTEMDYLVVENFLLAKTRQPAVEERRVLAKRVRARLSGRAMTAPHSIPELDRKGLREFGLVTGGIVAVLFGLFFPWLLERAVAALAVDRVRRARRLAAW